MTESHKFLLESRVRTLKSFVAHTSYYLLVGIVLVAAGCAVPRITSINPTYGPQVT
jgi:hypothetical protein